jgi:aspartate aminotransferase-like enzyme
MSFPASIPAGPVRKRSPSPHAKLPVESPDPDGLEEFSVVYTNRSLNHMSKKFQQVMKDVSSCFKRVYGGHSVALVPGSGTFAMESVARQFGTKQVCMVVRNGYFSYRWSQILNVGGIAEEEIVLRGRPVENGTNPFYAPCPVEDVVEAIHRHRPRVVFAPHVETSSGIILPDEYMKAVADAVHAVGGMFVLDCIASGCIWVDMAAIGVDVLISAPQKGWSSPPSIGIVVLSKKARMRLDETQATAFALDLQKWVAVMETYEKGGHMYHTTMPTDSIIRLRDVQLETQAYGFDRIRCEQLELGNMVRRLLASKGYKSVAAPGFCAPGVVVSYTSDPEVKTGAKFAALGVQIAAGVPLMLDEFTTESPEFRTFRLGLFGIDKLKSLQDTTGKLAQALERLSIATTVKPTARL